jgi:hypothetical protein
MVRHKNSTYKGTNFTLKMDFTWQYTMCSSRLNTFSVLKLENWFFMQLCRSVFTNELTGSKHKATNLVFSNFSSNVSQFEQLKKPKVLLVQNSFSSVCQLKKKIKINILKKNIDSGFCCLVV